MPPGPPPGMNFRYEKVPPPKSIADVPRYLKELCGGFFSRLAYIFRLVWKTGPWILFAMLAISLLQGITPVIGSKISQHVLNEMQSSYGNFSGALGDFLRSPCVLSADLSVQLQHSDKPCQHTQERGQPHFGRTGRADCQAGDHEQGKGAGSAVL
ncbi:MAG: hypothetical protein L6V84_01820 [Oscillospiraceae bacterium]|nr:MAG: hypothetical protein L6V84_01820 [Oscillospiraceae bacterium]